MDVVWLILDSLSFRETPFAPDGPETMPRLQELAASHAVVYTNAYTPGPSSPSAHGSMFTGELPSTTGMHEATPYFSADLDTIAGALSAHRSLLISTNPFIFNGLDRDFDETDDLRSAQYMLFPEATNPLEFHMRSDHASKLREWVAFVTNGGKPLRSLANGVSYKLWFRNQNAAIPRELPGDDTRYQYAATQNARIRAFLDRGDGDAFVVSNYMDVHPPFDASDEALARFAPDEAREDLPIEVAGQEILANYREGDERTVDLMSKLYRAAIWDADRNVAPFVEELLEDDTFVVVTADHGNWFRRREEFETELIHVPLLIFAPDEEARTVDWSVSIRDLATTTAEAAGVGADAFAGDSLLRADGHRLSITESIDEPDSDSPVAAHGGETSVQYDIAAIKGDARVDFVGGMYDEKAGSADAVSELRAAIDDLASRPPRTGGTERIEYDPETEQRLKDLGYLS